MADFSPKTVSIIDANSIPALPGADNSSLDSCAFSNDMEYFKISIEILSGFLGFPANLRVLWILLWARVERLTSDLYTVSLAFMDAMNCLCLTITITIYDSETGIFYFYFFYFVYYLNELGVPPLLACICLDRYVAVLHPTTFLRLRDNKLRILTTVVIWSCALSYAIFNLTDDSVNVNYYITFTVFIVCFLLIIFCNLSLLKALMDSGPVARDSMHPVKKRAFITVLIIFMIITVSFLPDVILYIFNMFTIYFDNFIIDPCVLPACMALFVLRSALQPLFFLYRARKLPFMSSTNSNIVCCSGS
ncbi:proteinase-activated receptor 3-like [Denticeps clupeoides]|uniref:proteinase-activated receptor 3-like n=1 Tax=Denticeps clupeoides TaxID=299321 RepID=UPI0010A58CB9|nr:proteinase-activated receptor 3-like [Denticeps clupeoides]XP_028828281.1 proteinase-activated receptor 3-like [Denticeps clupeoides]